MEKTKHTDSLILDVEDYDVAVNEEEMLTMIIILAQNICQWWFVTLIN